MSNDKKQKGNWHLWLRRVGLTVVIIGALGAISFLVINRDKDWTGFGKGTTKEETRQKKDKTGPFTETVKYQSGKTLWDFLGLLAVGAVPIVIALFGYQFQKREQKRANDRAELERKMAKDNLDEEAIQKYLDGMDKLLLDEKLRKELFPGKKLKLIVDKELRKEILTYDRLKSLDNEDNDNPARDMARIRTITILRRLEVDRARQASIIHFLRDAKLYEFIFKNANLSTINLEGSQLGKANLQEADLSRANLQEAFLLEANLQQANLLEANLQQANLVEVEKLTPKQIKTACFWEKAIYKGEWNYEKRTWIAIEPDNTKFIEELKKDKSSDPEKPIDCTFWEKQSN